MSVKQNKNQGFDLYMRTGPGVRFSKVPVTVTGPDKYIFICFSPIPH